MARFSTLSPLAIASAALSFFASFTFAQVSTACQPLNTTGCPADPAFGTDYLFHFNSTPSTTFWETTAGTVGYDNENGASFTINKQGDSPTIRSAFYIFFGRTEMFIKAAGGTGIISSVMFLSDDLDEIDWEFMGGNTSYVETNYFGKGRQDFNNAIYYPVDGGIIEDFHNYTTIWTNTSLDFYIDGDKVRTLLPKSANNTNNYPQTPMRVSIGIWAGGDPTLPKGTREWAGGDTDYSKGPFTMYVKSAQVTDYNTGKEYSYGDHSGSWQSIKIASGNSTVMDTINAKPAETVSDKWNKLPSGAHIAVYASAGGVGAIIVAVGLYYCIKQRRRGREENRRYEERMAQERTELEQYRKAGIDPDSLAVENSEYNAKEMRNDGSSFANEYNIPGTPDSTAEEKERAWNAAAVKSGAAGGVAGAFAADSAMRSPMPLLHNGAQSPSADRSFNSSAPQSPYGNIDPRQRTQSPANPVSPMQSPSPGMASSGFALPPVNSQLRSASAPNAQMRGSPRPDLGSGPGIMRTQSPAYMTPGAAPQRSYTADPWRNQSNSTAPSNYSAPGYNNGTRNYSAPGYGGPNNPASNTFYGTQGNYGGGFDNNYWR